jgi:two-component system, OmpR family, phosphate regulon sensor histidine kinase PhoR
MATDLVLVGKFRGRLSTFLILFVSFLVIIAVATVTLTGSVNRYWQGVIQDEITRDLTGKARMFAARVDTDRLHTIQDITSQEGQYAGARATVIDVNGKVLADSEIPVAALDGEGKRPEFAAALRGQTGVKSRKRNTFGVSVLYVAVPVSGGAVRLACPLADVDIATAHTRHVMFLGIAAAIIAALLVSAAGAGLIYGKTSG